ncbi:MAG: flagellar hook-basal body protein [Mycobacterium sp.]|jgi:flagellar hook protein FlgE|nr:flagellar hook-basal body protein [Mycobacterium sp.]
MLRSLFAGISGLRAHQTMMDVTGNNIANVNTAGFKTSQTVFQDTLSQLIQGAGAPQGAAGGTNPAQVGLGVRVGGIFTNFGQGSAQATGRSTDLMIQGDGFFVVRKDGQDLYTRAGAFNFDSLGQLVSPDGGKVMGWGAVNGAINTNAAAAPLSLPIGTMLPPAVTGNVAVAGNLPGDSTSTAPLITSITVYDAQGNAIALQTSFTKTSATTWDVSISDGTTTVGPNPLTFSASGTTPTPSTMTFGGINVDLSKITNYAGVATAQAVSQDGSAVGSLQAFSISPDGTLVGVFSNGLRQNLGQIAMASFNNPPGLEKVGNTSFRATVNSGVAQLGVAGSGGRGALAGGSLEMSNVDLAQEFTNLIVAQRGFQANSKVITASDEILQDLVNLKR